MEFLLATCWSWARLLEYHMYGVIFFEASLIELLSYISFALLPGKHELIVVTRHSRLGNLFTVKSS